MGADLNFVAVSRAFSNNAGHRWLATFVTAKHTTAMLSSYCECDGGCVILQQES